MDLSHRDDSQVRPLDMHTVLLGSIELIRHLVESDNVHIKLHMHAKKTKITGNANQLQNAIINIATNACEATEEKGGALTFSTKTLTLSEEVLDSMGEISNYSEFLLLSIEDTGVGMDGQVIEHLFEPFFTTKPSGVGLGLLSARDCIKAHSGFIKVYSKKGDGSRFDIYLPLLIDE